MNKREHFLRKDLDTYKPKFKLLCNKYKFSIEKVAKVINKDYICKIIKIEEL